MGKTTMLLYSLSLKKKKLAQQMICLASEVKVLEVWVG